MFSQVIKSVVFQAEDVIRDLTVTGVQTCALPIYDEEVLVPESVSATRDALSCESALLDRRGVHRCDIWQVLRDPLPALPFVGARPDVAVRSPEVEAHGIEAVVVHALAH